jgi:hypothetical protein
MMVMAAPGSAVREALWAKEVTGRRRHNARKKTRIPFFIEIPPSIY